MTIPFRQDQCRNEEVVVEFQNRLFFQEILGDFERFIEITGQQPLVESHFGGKHRLVAQKNVQEMEARDMAAKDDQTNGERRG